MIAVVPPTALLLRPVEIVTDKRDLCIDAWNLRVRRFNKGRGQ